MSISSALCAVCSVSVTIYKTIYAERIQSFSRVVMNVTNEIHERGRGRQPEGLCERFTGCNAFSPLKEADADWFTDENSFHLGCSAQAEVTIAVSNS